LLWSQRLAASADTLHLRSGANIEGTLLGADTRQIKFLGPDGQPKTYSLTEVEGIVKLQFPTD